MRRNDVNRNGVEFVFGVANPPEHSELSDPELALNKKINGVPTLRRTGDTETSVVLVQCWCRSPLAVVWHVDRSARELDPLLYVSAQLIIDADRNAHLVERVLRTGREYPMDCASHGRQILSSDNLLPIATRSVATRLTGQSSSAKKFILQRPE
ncbi:hypothetical protein [Enemella evansiae]|uniref:hypothetical protein n=1 Tax=Enemella evansiae TaxID=2016499 RepID=UPI000B96A85F|nr:hypothetical protein [Enemella evansiae]OYO05444.1 hypothetical protein CGZ97_01560 [Enemella evansiae]